ncbi:transmembrane protein 272-like [Neosynchiropus ocellatus]
MNSGSRVGWKLHGDVLISVTAVLNIIWWMVMIAAISMGAIHLGSCPVQPMIPIYLLVLGVSTLVSLLLVYSVNIWQGGVVNTLASILVVLLHIFTLCWFVAGTDWVYRVYLPNNVPGEVGYCHRTIYLFAFAVTTVIWVVLTMVLLGCCCFLCVTCCLALGARERLLPEREEPYGAVDSCAGDV